MIEKASEILEQFIAKEAQRIEGIKMPHMPTLGSAYEEITRQGIDSNFIIPKGLDLKVVSGFISIADEMLPEQIDCMLVHGDGERYGLTAQYIYDIEKVLCIFEVKKTLNKTDFKDALEHLNKIRQKFAQHFEKKLIEDGYEPRLDAPAKLFSQITGKPAPEKYHEIHALTPEDGILFYTLVQECYAPVSIIHGYGGYKTESGLRKSFVDILSESRNSNGIGFGIPSLPTLVTANNFCLVKNNGIPYMALQGANNWIAISSTRHNPAYIMLEIIWSKISLSFNVAMPWKDTLETENLSPLLTAIVRKEGEQAGWWYKTNEPSEKLLEREAKIEWEPSPLSQAAITLTNLIMIRGGQFDITESSEWLEEKFGATFDEITEELISTGYFMDDNGLIRPIETVTYIATANDNSGVVATDRKMLELWLEKQVQSFVISVFAFI
ncbi:TPA: DUF6602 domain-containing protein [Photobacterium damselae]|uniref:DUF6602 domain-containing protein n=1 Tax=Photobacterium damselae subsp. damselae TaxID=85581 RepID=A0A850QY01_PHODD|nr:DUF6602 domain-containing protein [Photobacterium damselae]NVH50246.1 hypothetical protein [Photobacterium damselae subsp. damselae]NVO81445.1 hypothetical protein [Photobacterium damselae subsp. damselae]NVP00189.1 hypothetical protein [Photobacterium damselae subsp. damselae]